MANLNTINPTALQLLINETLYSFPVSDVREPAIAEESASPSFAYLGKNKRKYLFIVFEPNHPFFSEEALAAFSKTIAALGMAMSDIAVFNLASSSGTVDAATLFTFFDPKKVIYLGVSPQVLGLTPLTPNTPSQKNDRTSLFTYSFEEMLNDTQKKKTFWLQLKNL